MPGTKARDTPDSMAARKLAMNAKQKSHYPAIRSLLRKHYGAVFVSPEGQLLIDPNRCAGD